MSDRILVGWVATISLNANEVGIVEARRGRACLRFSDRIRAPPLALLRADFDRFAADQRAWLAVARDPHPIVFAGFQIPLDRNCVEPLIALVNDALAFAEAKEPRGAPNISSEA